MSRYVPGVAFLFAPANRADIIPKAAERADVVILDLEDGAGDIDRPRAYQNIRDAQLDPERTFIRIVGPQDDNHKDDLDFVRTTRYTKIIVPKIREALPETLGEGLEIVPIIETPQAILNIGTIAADPRVIGLYWGADDLTIELGGLHSRYKNDESHTGMYRDTMTYARVQTLMYAAAYDKFALDAVYQDFSDDEGLYREALDSARSGFNAFPCIHPRQVPIVRKAFAPSPERVAWAQRVVAESKQHPGAFQLDGEMVDAPLIKQAHILLSRMQ
ncbi:CoA ester lyase [Corynebacterium sp. sy017]|uniref:HpcH/HpaI aldolase/citrate lyase family protein n=1 Tax=unclassified Corynebacterium TaxID=2624378 RepID=UPI0011857661|nr:MULTISPECIES: CoA ester lyase [unclassified Corynebacterium]MBP3088839.1 CoA ester lyase [Corynebacterium sp. sy017]QDZ42231.1 CoA ester lyase [Corynebacterium sp. sy039]TSD91182.1 CoA ester lyase [Corynebacterium sp. SY003]